MAMVFLKGVCQQGSPEPLGASWDGHGVNFAVFSEHASRVELCFFDHPSAVFASCVFVVPYRTGCVWHVYCPGVLPGQCYGYKVWGPYSPHEGHRFQGRRTLVDPYAKSIAGDAQHHPSVYDAGEGDSTPYVFKSVVVDDKFDWKQDTAPRIPWARTCIYECHVKGLTQQHPQVPPHLRGTYLGLCSEPVIDHLKDLGITAVELLPVHMSFSEKRLLEKGLINHWGYNTLGFFAPDIRYAAVKEGCVVKQFKTMVQTLHTHGIEVLLDVVYNHTAEGGEDGPVWCLKGFDNSVYYRLNPSAKNTYEDFSGCGNTLNLEHPQVLRYVMDSLRYWVTHMHVDGFRLDLATALVQPPHATCYAWSTFFALIQQDPVLNKVKWIAEPWDIRPHSYALGAFPLGWSEWNGVFRDGVRQYWLGKAPQASHIAYRIGGSTDVFQNTLRGSSASINFVTCHDGFSLNDLVSYNHKHNEDNHENNQDGTDTNHSDNHGVEGATENPDICAMRIKQQRNMLALLLLSKGVPMLRSGDEWMQSLGGNNNPYCQDNPSSWVKWDFLSDTHMECIRTLLQIRQKIPLLQQEAFFSEATSDVVWFHPKGHVFEKEDWHQDLNGVLGFGIGLLFSGHAVLCLMNPTQEEIFFKTAVENFPENNWSCVFSTDASNRYEKNGCVLKAKSLMVWIRDVKF
jgi:isoamylase